MPSKPTSNGLCERCHDAENSRQFDFTKYWVKIVHKGLDDYKDPKVHRGIKPRIPRRGIDNLTKKPFQNRDWSRVFEDLFLFWNRLQAKAIAERSPSHERSLFHVIPAGRPVRSDA